MSRSFERSKCVCLVVVLLVISVYSTVKCLETNLNLGNGNETMSLKNKDELKSLFVVARHSIRAPVKYPPTDEFLSAQNFPRGPGYLTQKGIDSSLRVGKIWKRWYPTMMKGDAREVWARSSEAYRCSETAQSVLFSIYSSKHYQPISVIVPPANRDKYTSSNSLSDEELFKFMDGHYNTVVRSADGSLMTVSDVFEFVGQMFGLEKDTNPFDMFLYLDGLVSLKHENLDQPSWYKDNRQLIDSVYNIIYERLTATLRPYYGYFLLQSLANRMKLVKDGKVSHGDKLNLFMFHDFSISAILTCLDEGFERLKAEFLGGVFFELYQRAQDGSHYFKVYWSKGLRPNGTYFDREALNLKWNNGTNVIEFDDLWSRFHNNIFEDYMTNNKNALLGYTGEDAFV